MEINIKNVVDNDEIFELLKKITNSITEALLPYSKDENKHEYLQQIISTALIGTFCVSLGNMSKNEATEIANFYINQFFNDETSHD